MQSQGVIKGQFICSESFKKQFPEILVYVDGFIHRKVINNDGSFELKIEREQEEYLINFEINNSIVKTYNYKHEWTKRKRSKSIAFEKECEIISKNATKDIEQNSLKLHVFPEIRLSKRDIKFQKEHNFNYFLINKREGYKLYKCYKKYNDIALNYLVLSKNLSLKKLNKNTIGIKSFTLNDTN